MSIARGTRLGTFEIQTLVGAGGMGEVYRARDTRLERTVAIKVLPPLWADSVDMRQRFEREAQTIASLNHPHICTLHDIGRHQDPSSGATIDFLVMEFLEGETLAQRLERGPLGLDEALRVGIAIADALDKAHRKGVTHRDLKPGNIFLVRGGGPSDPPIAKLLDFGLAKLRAGGAPGSGRGSASATPTDPQLTTHGAILGTLQYMAPEQLEGLEADARTDIFAFGVVLHEMITGKKTFEGKSRVLLISAIATAEPAPLAASQPAISPALDHVVRTCLAKDPEERWQTARDVLAELQWIAAGGADALAPPPASASARGTWNRRWIGAVATTGLAVAAVSAALAFFLPESEAAEPTRFRVPIQLSAQPTQIVGGNVVFDAANVSVSPDGRWIAFVARANPQDTFTLYVRPVAGVTPQRVAGTDAATQPFWSADSQSIAFVSGGKLRKVDIKGGATEDVCDVANFVGGSWNSEGTIIFGTPQGLFRVSAQGGKPEALTTLAKSEAGHFWPRFLPDGRHYLYLAWSSAEDGRAIYAGTLGSNERMKVINTESKSVYSDPGYLLFRSDNAVYARRFDPGSLAVSGDAIRVADEVTSSSSANGQGDFDVSTNGTLIYYQSAGGPGLIGPQSDGASWQLQWISRNGQDLERAGPYGTYRGFELSPNGRRIAVHRHEPTGGDVIVLEPRGASLNITVDASRHNSMPIWSPDGSRIVYNSLRDGKWGLYEARSNGTGYERLLFESELLKVPMSWPDDRHLVFWVQDPKSAGDVWLLTLGDKKAEASPLIATAQYNESHPQVSPDKKWIAYTSNRTGRNEIYVQPFPTGSGFYKVSINGGDWARWNPAANELFFRELGDGAFVGDILSAPFTVTDGAFENSDPKPLVETGAMNLAHSSGDYHMYAVAPDGQSFLVLQFVNRLVNLASVGAIGPDPDFGLIVALNWTSALENGTR